MLVIISIYFVFLQLCYLVFNVRDIMCKNGKWILQLDNKNDHIYFTYLDKQTMVFVHPVHPPFIL